MDKRFRPLAVIGLLTALIAASCASTVPIEAGVASSVDDQPAEVSAPDAPAAAAQGNASQGNVDQASADGPDAPALEPAPQIVRLDSTWGETLQLADVEADWDRPGYLPGPTHDARLIRYVPVARTWPLLRTEPAGTTVVADLTDSPYPLVGLTPDGFGAYVSVPDPDQRASCPEGATGHVLAIAAVDGSTETRRAEPASAVPANVSAVHYGPEDRVALYTSCGKYNGEVMLGRVLPNGDFADLRSVDPALSNALWMWEPTWHWTVDEQLLLVIPQEGYVRENSLDVSTANVFVDFETGAIVNAWATEIVRASPARRAVKIETTKSEVLVNQTMRPEWTGTVTGIATNPYNDEVIVTGTDGAWLTRATPEAFEIVKLTSAEVNGAVWAPTAEWAATTGPAGTVIFDQGTDNPILIGDSPSASPFYSPSTRTLVVAEQRDEQTVVVGYRFDESLAADQVSVVDTDDALSSGGIGPLRIGMTVAEATQATGAEFNVEHLGHLSEELSPGECVWIRSDDLPEFGFLGESKGSTPDEVEIMTISTGSTSYTTPSGIRVGDLRQTVLDTFPGQINDQQHVYDPSGRYLDFVPSDPDETTTVRFVTEGPQVRSITVGRMPWVFYIEGCA